MASKLGFLLTLFFVMVVVAYAGDLCAVNAIYTRLDSVAVTAAYQIALQRGITNSITQFVSEEAGAMIESLNNGPVAFGDTFRFKIYREYQSLIISKEPMVITVTRSAVIGYLY